MYSMYRDALRCFYFFSLPVQCFQLLVVLGQLDRVPKSPCKSKPFALTSRKESDSYKGNMGQNPTMLNLSMAQGFISPFLSLLPLNPPVILPLIFHSHHPHSLNFISSSLPQYPPVLQIITPN